MICPFCRQSDIPDNPGKTICLSCKTVMEIDDRGECVFVDTESPRMTMYGQSVELMGCVGSVLSQKGKADAPILNPEPDASPVTPPRSGA
jgi:hypothetical protein